MLQQLQAGPQPVFEEVGHGVELDRAPLLLRMRRDAPVPRLPQPTSASLMVLFPPACTRGTAISERAAAARCSGLPDQLRWSVDSRRRLLWRSHKGSSFRIWIFEEGAPEDGVRAGISDNLISGYLGNRRPGPVARFARTWNLRGTMAGGGEPFNRP